MAEKKPRWYVIDVYSGSEKRVAQNIEDKVAKKGLSDQILKVLVPTEKVVELRRGVKVQKEKSFFPGYVLVQMILSDESWALIRGVPRVSRLLGGMQRPSPIGDREVERLMGQIEEGVKAPRSTLVFEVGEEVRISDGPFSTFSGLVEEVDEEKERLKVSVSIFGRSTPVDLEYVQVEKISG